MSRITKPKQPTDENVKVEDLLKNGKFENIEELLVIHINLRKNLIRHFRIKPLKMLLILITILYMKKKKLILMMKK